MTAPLASPPGLQAAAKTPEAPEHRNDRRRVLLLACMCGLVGPERVTERILQDVGEQTS